jgi:hypothetical protein
MENTAVFKRFAFIDDSNAIILLRAGYFTTRFISTPYSVNGMVIDEMEGMWNEEITTQSKYYPRICVEGLRKTARTSRQLISQAGFYTDTSEM